MSFKIPKLVNVNPSSPNGLYQQTLVDGVTTSEGAAGVNALEASVKTTA